MDNDSIWFRIGYRLERAKHEPPGRGLRSLAERRARADVDAPKVGPTARVEDRVVQTLVTAGGATLVGTLLKSWPPSSRPGVTGLVRAALAGAGAAALTGWLAPLLFQRPEVEATKVDLGERMIGGAARGLVYASVVAPRLPGPPLLRGAVFGGVEYLVAPWGGLLEVLGRQAPHKRIPLLSALVVDQASRNGALGEHLAFAITLALLYPRPSEQAEIELQGH